jgi:hypothetical protein
MRQNLRGIIVDQRRAICAQRAVGRKVLLVNRDSLLAQPGKQRGPVKRPVIHYHAAHPIDRPRQVNRRGPGRLKLFGHNREARLSPRTAGALEPERNSHGGGNSDRRRAPDYHRANRIGDAAIVFVNPIYLAAWEQPLIDHAHAIRAPLHRIDSHRKFFLPADSH